MNYAEQLKDPRWQKKRLEVFQAANYQCERCRDAGSQLHSHHLFYKREMMLWEYRTEDIMCVCGKCHDQLAFVRDTLLQDAGKDIEELAVQITMLQGLGLTNKQIIDRLKNWVSAYTEFAGGEK